MQVTFSLEGLRTAVENGLLKYVAPGRFHWLASLNRQLEHKATAAVICLQPPLRCIHLGMKMLSCAEFPWTSAARRSRRCTKFRRWQCRSFELASETGACPALHHRLGARAASSEAGPMVRGSGAALECRIDAAAVCASH